MSGRDIDENHPLYGTIRSVLNIARQNFEEGRKLLAAGASDAADRKFAEAENGLLTVRALFPLNQEASILDLRMAKLRKSRDEYQRELADKVREARSLLSTQTATAYALLTDIREIEPDYPGLDELILQAEYDLNIRERPIAPQVLAQAQELLRSAREIYDQYGEDRYDPVIRESQYKRALGLLDQALALNPRLTAASSLKDDIQTTVGGNVVYALASDAQRQFEKARDLYIEENNVPDAFVITTQLLKDENNRGFKPLVELHNRLLSELGRS